MTLQDRINAVERELIVDALIAHAGNITLAALALATARQDLYRRMKRLGIDPTPYRNRPQPPRGATIPRPAVSGVPFDP